jgi:hypothetical protein
MRREGRQLMRFPLLLGRCAIPGNPPPRERRADEEQARQERDDGDDGEFGWHVPLVPMKVRKTMSPASAGPGSMAGGAEMAQTY